MVQIYNCTKIQKKSPPYFQGGDFGVVVLFCQNWDFLDLKTIQLSINQLNPNSDNFSCSTETLEGLKKPLPECGNYSGSGRRPFQSCLIS